MLRLRQLAAALLLVLAPAVQALAPGQVAPALSGPLLMDEGTASLKQFRGKVVLLDFFASWCGPCALSLPALEALRLDLQQRYPDRFEILAVNVDTQAEAGRKFLQRRPVSYPTISDARGAIAKAYELPGMPSSFIIDAQGRLVEIHEGFRPGDAETLSRKLEALLAPATSP